MSVIERGVSTFGGRTAALAACLVAGAACPAAPAFAQVGPCPAVTGEDATVVVPESAVAPGTPLAAGDVLRAYGDDGGCVGETEWLEEGGAALTLWGDDVVTPGQEGLAEGEAFELRAVRGAEEVALEVSFEVVLSAPPGTGAEYHPDAIYFVSELAGGNPTAGEQGLPGGFRLSEVYPNPFASAASFTLEVAQTQRVTATVFDVLGRSVRRLSDGRLEEGAVHRFTVEANGLASGSYLVLIRGEHFAESRRFTLLR